MIKSLRRKFILVSMCSVFVVLFTIMGIADIVNYKNIIDRADKITEILAENGGTFTEPKKPENNGEISTESESSNRSEQTTVSENDDNSQPPKEELPPEMGKGIMEKNGLSPEIPFSSRFFTVYFDEDKNIKSVYDEQIASINSDEAKSFAKTLIKEDPEYGFKDVYRYRIIKTDDGYMMIFLDCRQELDSFKSATLSMIAVSLAGLVAVFILVLFFSKIVFRPVEETYQKQKRFITDASHELKTPLTIIDANTEVIEMECGENQWTKSTKNQIDRLTTLTNQMVTLSRLDEETKQEDLREFSLSDVLADSVESFEAIAKTREKKIHIDLDENIEFFGSEKSLRQLIGLLLDNAIKYSSENGNIYIRLKSSGRKIHFEVENDVDSISPGNQNILFERFYRPDKSRNSKTGGSGIGLSVVKAIVDSHKGKISAHSEDGKQLKITIEFKKNK